MKRLLLALTIVALLVPTARQATAADVSVDFFYNNLSGGNWIEVGDYGYGWQPDITVSDPNWRPYSDGYWAYTDVGWTWVSYEDFGWATYHYGRWSRVADYGWVWFPGNDLEWGPAWVSWRTGGDYIGWAPLPPRGPGIAYAGVSIGGQVDVEFDIGPAYYNFVDVRYIGEPVLRDRIFAPSQNVTYINQTVNVTNITYNNNTVYNYGPDYSALSARSSRPIQRLNIERQQNVDLSTAAKSGALTKVQGDKLVVAAPNKLQKSAKLIAPPSVKAKVAQPKIEHGWSGISNEAELKQKMKTENPKNIPPPTGAAATGRTPGGASPAAAAVASAAPAPATSVTPFERGKGRGRPGGQVQPSLTGTPAGSPAGAGSPAIQGSPAGRERGKPPGGRRGELPASPSGQTGAASVAPEGTQPPSKHKGQLERGNLTPTPGQPGGASNQPPPGKHKGPPATTETPYSAGGPGGAAEAQGGRHKGPPAGAQPPAAASTTPYSAGGPGGAAEAQGGRHKGPPTGAQPPAAASTPYSAGGPGGPAEAQGGRQKGPPAGAQPAASAAERGPGGPGAPGRPGGGKKKGEASPSPTP